MASKRGCRTSEKQYHIYVTFLENNPRFRSGKITSQNSEEFTQLWKELTQKLNSLGSGAVKSTEQWKKSFTEWKSVVRKKKRNNETLKAYEEALLPLIGPVAISGLNTQELGLPLMDTECPDVGDISNTDIELIYIEPVEEPVPEETHSLENTPEEIPTQHSGKKKKYSTGYQTKSKLAIQLAKSTEETAAALNNIAGALNNIALAIREGCQMIAEKIENSQE